MRSQASIITASSTHTRQFCTCSRNRITAWETMIKPCCKRSVPTRANSVVCGSWYGVKVRLATTCKMIHPMLPPSCSRRLERSEEHTSELQSLRHLVCRLLLGNDTATAEIYPLSLHDALPIWYGVKVRLATTCKMIPPMLPPSCSRRLE